MTQTLRSAERRAHCPAWPFAHESDLQRQSVSALSSAPAAARGESWPHSADALPRRRSLQVSAWIARRLNVAQQRARSKLGAGAVGPAQCQSEWRLGLQGGDGAGLVLCLQAFNSHHFAVSAARFLRPQAPRRSVQHRRRHVSPTIDVRESRMATEQRKSRWPLRCGRVECAHSDDVNSDFTGFGPRCSVTIFCRLVQ